MNVGCLLHEACQRSKRLEIHKRGKWGRHASATVSTPVVTVTRVCSRGRGEYGGFGEYGQPDWLGYMPWKRQEKSH